MACVLLETTPSCHDPSHTQCHLLGPQTCMGPPRAHASARTAPASGAVHETPYFHRNCHSSAASNKCTVQALQDNQQCRLQSCAFKNQN